MFKLLKTEDKARRGEFTCPHGTVQTPVFMNVGTQAAIKGALSAEDLEHIGTQVELSNTYHLHLRPGDEVVKKMGGLHKFMTWNGPILTDSGGFQVFSLAGLRKIKEEGVTFASHLDGHRIFMGPEESMRIQSNLGSDIAMAFDECVENPATYPYAKASCERTARWLARCKQALAKYNAEPDAVNPGQQLWGINQGATFKDLRIWHMQEIAKLDLPGYAIGGLAVGESTEEMYRIIQENPYRLADDMNGIGFKLADEIAKKAGIGSHSDFRIRSGIIYMLQQGTLSGHIYIPAALLVEKTAQMLGVEEEAVDHLLQSLQMDRKIVVKKIDDVSVVYGASLYRLELETAGLLKNLGVDYSVDEKEVGKVLDRIEKREGIDLDDHQREAVYSAAGNGVLVITGGPGTGKTTTINAIIKYLEYEGLEMRLAAPTGRAAKRMSEATGREAQTIHRMLELSGGPDDDRLRTQFERNQDNPLETDVVIIDEMSMVDIYLMNALLKAIAVGTRLILVGDVNQLPSVGPGNVLKDIIDSECFQVRLTKIFRQALESDIIKNAHLINEGRQIELGNKSQDFFCLKRYDVQQILGVMVLLIRDKLPKFVNARPYDIQVLTPMRKGELGVERLNTVLQHYLNPPSPDKKEREFHQGVIREGDKVMQIRNNYQIEWEVLGHYNLPLDKGVGVFNGDMGVAINDFLY